jgi:S1-C subfamily serine protease
LAGCNAQTADAQATPDADSQSRSGEAVAQADTSTESAGPNQISVRQLQTQLQDVYGRAHPAVVNITSQVMTPGIFNQPVPQQGAGSGFLWDDQGHVVTNFHVLQNAESISVTLADGRIFEAEVVGDDPFTDLAVLRIDADDLPEPLSLANSDGLGVGQFVAAVGNPFNFEQTLTFGVISALGRVIRTPGGRFISEAIQTDTPINPGNSGGPLLDMNGNVIGVNSAIISPTGASAGIGFAISANTVGQVVPSLIENGEFPHPWIGIQALNLMPGFVRLLQQTDVAMPVDEGVLIVNVLSNGPAAEAGLQGGQRQLRVGNMALPVGGDIIVGINGVEITNYKDLVVYLETETEIGDTIEVRFYRGDAERTTDLTVGERPERVQADMNR